MADNEFLTGYLSGQCETRSGSNGNGGLFGNGWEGIIGLIVILALLGGAFGMGGGGLFGGGGGGFRGTGCGYCATQADVRSAVDQQTLISKIDQQTYGIADTFTALNNTLNNNFRGIDNAICTLGYQNQAGVNALSAQLAQCCCDTRAAIHDNTTQGVMNTNSLSRQISDCCCDLEKMNMQNRFDSAQANCGTLAAIDKLGDRIIGYLSNQETQNLRDEVQGYRLAASQAKQNQYLLDALRPCPVPAYLTCNPYASAPTLSYGSRDGGCGCGCGSGFAV